MPDYARAEDGSTLELYPDTDNWSALQAFCLAHTDILLPAGRWPVSRTVNLQTGFHKMQGRAVEATVLDLYAAFPGPVLGIGGDNRWQGSAGFGKADGITLADMTFLASFTHTEADHSAGAWTNCKCIFNNWGDDMTIHRVKVEGNPYEGIIVGSNCRDIELKHIVAKNCGNGGPAYTQSTAGINATSVNLLIDGFMCTGCGHGVESGNTNVVIRNGCVQDPGVGLPQIGIHIGSTGYGLYRTYIEDCVISGCENAIGGGPNGIGRLAAVFIRRNRIIDGTIGFAGGQTTNGVSHPDAGPDTEGSFIEDNQIDFPNFASVPAIQYNGGPAEAHEVFGREPLTIRRNTIRRYELDLHISADILFAGKITANCIVEENFLHGRQFSPVQGDIASLTSGANIAVPGFPTLTHGFNFAFNASGERREVAVSIEGS